MQGIGDLLRELDAVAAGTKTDAATQRLLAPAQAAGDAEPRASPGALVPGQRLHAPPRRRRAHVRRVRREVDGEIDRCLLDLGVANRILIARLEKQQMLQNEAAGGTETVALRIGMPRDDNADNIKRCIRTIQGLNN